MKSLPPPSNQQIAKLLRSVAAALELEPGDNRFRIAAYQRAADSAEHATSDLKDLWDAGRIGELPGIGENITRHLEELFRTGRVRHFQAILKPYPPALFELMDIPGLGPKRSLSLCKALGLSKAHTAIKELEKAVKKGRVAEIEGFGSDLESQIKENIVMYRKRAKRMLLSDADRISADLLGWMTKNPAVKQADVLGSLRRRSATVGDIDISVSTTRPDEVIRHFSSYPKKIRVVEAGTKTATLLLRDQISVDLMTGEPTSYGSLLQHFTGSKLHNIALREIALKAGYSLSEYGVKSQTGISQFATEDLLYKFFGLQFIPPELREGNEELELARKESLPELISLSDIRGDIQVHSNFDTEPTHDLGKNTIQSLAETGRVLGYEYLGLTEHNPGFSQHTLSQIESLIKRKAEAIDRFNSEHEKDNENLPHLFNGLEIDIQADGKRAFPDRCLDILDYACVSIHSSFRQSSKVMTDRILTGLDHPKVRFLAHPTGRILGTRDGIQADWEKIFGYCLRNNKWLEINSFPNRLDLPDNLARQAAILGVKLVINTDSHSVDHLPYMKYGIDVARRAYISSAAIVNTLSFAKLCKILGREVK